MNVLLVGLQRGLVTLSSAPLTGMLLVKATLILSAGWLVHGLLACANPRWRVLLWRLVSVSLIILPMMSLLGSPFQLHFAVQPAEGFVSAPQVPATVFKEIDPPQAIAPTATQPVHVSQPARMDADPVLPDDIPVPLPIVTKSNPLVRHSALELCVALWLGVAGLLVGRGVIGLYRVRRLIYAAQPAGGEIEALLQQVTSDLGCSRVTVRLTDRISTPLLTGWLRPVLLVPARMAGGAYPHQELKAILAHEVLHLRSGDLFWTQVMGGLMLALWFHPLAWRVGRAHAAACEEVSDAASAGYLGDTEAYARTLARVAVEVAEMPLLSSGIAMARVPEIMRRLERLSHALPYPLARRRVAGFIALGLLASLALGGVAITPKGKGTAKDGRQISLPAGAFMRLGGREFQQEQPVGALAISPDGKIIATGNGTMPCVNLWEASTGRKIRQLDMPKSGAWALAFSPDGKTLAAAAGEHNADDPTVCFWSIPAYELRAVGAGLLKELDPQPIDPIHHGLVFYSLAFSPDGKTLLTGGEEGATFLWDVASSKEIRRWGHHRKNASVMAVAFSPDGKKVASGDNEGNLCVAEVDSDREPLRIKAAKSLLVALAFSADGKCIISGGATQAEYIRNQGMRYTGTVRLWDASTGAMVRELESAEKDSAVKGFAWSPDRRTLAVGYMDSTIRLWDPAVGKELKKLQAAQGDKWQGCQMAFTPDGHWLVSGGMGNVAGVWDLRSGRRLFDGNDAPTGEINELVYSPDGNTLVTGSADKTVRSWDTRTGRQLSVSTCEGWSARSAFSQNGNRLAFLNSKPAVVWRDMNEVVVQETTTGKIIRTLNIPTDSGREPLETLSLSPSGEILAVGYGESLIASSPSPAGHPVCIWSVKTGAKLGEIDGIVDGARAISFSADERSLVVVSGNGVIRFWDLATQAETRRIETKDGLGGATISSDHRRIAWVTFGSADLPGAPIRRKQVVIKSQRDGKELKGTQVEPTIIVWDIPTTGRVLRAADLKYHLLPGNDSFFWNLTLAQDGKRLLSMNADRLIQLWDVEKETVIGEVDATSIGGRRLYSIALDPTGRTLAAGLGDGTVLLWQVQHILRPNSGL